jgi:hypothetical protein
MTDELGTMDCRLALDVLILTGHVSWCMVAMVLFQDPSMHALVQGVLMIDDRQVG